MSRRSPTSLSRNGWLPMQHGAWAMLLAPLGVGIVCGGPSWRHIALSTCWVIGYAAFYACGQWLRSRRKPRYVPAMVTYAAIAAIAGVIAIAGRWQVALWGLAFAPLLAISLWCSATRRDRSIVNDTATVLAACLMTLVATSAGGHSDWGRAVPAAIALFAYFEGTVFYVKTQIRERNNPAMFRISVGYHLACLVVAAVASWWAAAFFAAAALRAWLLPHRGLRPLAVGLVEIALSLALCALALLGLLTR